VYVIDGYQVGESWGDWYRLQREVAREMYLEGDWDFNLWICDESLGPVDESAQVKA
jgi:hypothetical protein